MKNNFIMRKEYLDGLRDYEKKDFLDIILDYTFENKEPEFDEFDTFKKKTWEFIKKNIDNDYSSCENFLAD